MTAATDTLIAERPARVPFPVRRPSRATAAMSRALAAVLRDGCPGLRINAASDRIRQMQHAIGELEAFPGILRQTVKLGELRGVPDARQRGGELHGMGGEEHRPDMRAQAIAHASGLADLGGGIGLSQTSELGNLQADRIDDALPDQ